MTLVAQLSDLHLRPRGLPALRVVESNMLAERAVAAVNALDPVPDFVIVTGDLADKGETAAYRMAREILDRLKPPYAVVAGNHDCAATLKQCFSDRDWARQMPGDSLQFALTVKDLRVIGLNSAVAGRPHGHLEAEELEFLARALAAGPAVPTIIALHHPPVLTGVEHMDRINLHNAAALAAIVEGHGNVLRIVCGHDHRMIVAPFAGTVVTVAPGTAHQVLLDLRSGGQSGFTFEPPAFLLHAYSARAGLVTHMAHVERYAGPFPFAPDRTADWP